MAGFSNYLEGKLQEWIFKQTQLPTPPAALAFSLHSADPGDTGASELAHTNGYERAALAPDANNSTNTDYNATATVGTATRITNKADIAFPAATADWNSAAAIQYWAIWDSATYGAGNCLCSGTIGPGGGGVVVKNGTTLKWLGGSPGNWNFDAD